VDIGKEKSGVAEIARNKLTSSLFGWKPVYVDSGFVSTTVC
jgi:hypothetical protein